MRCLFCDKELPLFKRLAGSDFCSDTHRQQYQQEYSQLALNRLLQAKPADDHGRQGERTAALRSSPVAKKALPVEQVLPAEPARMTQLAAPVLQDQSSKASSAAAVETPPAARPRTIAPAVAGPLEYRPRAATAQCDSQMAEEIEPVTSVLREIPFGDVEPEKVFMETANPITFEALENPAEAPLHIRRGRVEVREFAPASPIFDLGIQLEEPWMETAAQPVALSFSAAPSHAEAKPWVEAPREFAAGHVQLGELARLDLPTTAFEVPAAAQPDIAAETSPAVKAELPEPVVSPPGAPLVPPASPAAPGPKLFAQPMPIVLRKVPGGKARPVQIFTSMLAGNAKARIPEYEALPLRPAMVLARGQVTSARAPLKAGAGAGQDAPKTASTAQSPAPLSGANSTADTGEAAAKPVPPPEAAAAAPASSTSQPGVSRVPVPPPPLPASASEALAPARSTKNPLSIIAPAAEAKKSLPPRPGGSATKRGARTGLKVAAAAACLLLLAGGAWFYVARVMGSKGIISTTGGAGSEWIENFSPDARHPRTVSILRKSQGLSDYTLEFSASVDVKALGWVFRAKDPANFYVGRIEEQETPAGFSAVFVHFPVIAGVPQQRKRSPAVLPAAPGTVYKIRLEASGEHFTAWIQDRKVEEWTDGRLLAGGAGLYSEDGERALLQSGFRVIPVIPKPVTR